MKTNQANSKLHCEHCKGDMAFGHDVIRVEKCVNGPRGVIPLGESFTFCSEACVSRFFDQEPIGNLTEVPRRIP